jgi:hypothetical protein
MKGVSDKEAQALLDRELNIPVFGTSERSCFRRCPQKWWWTYRMGLVPKGDHPDALWFGIGIHEALAQWYGKGFNRSKVHPADYFLDWCGDEERVIRRSKESWELEDGPKFEDAKLLGQAMLEQYIDEYGRDQDWEVLAVEHPFIIKVVRDGVPLAYFASTWDGVYRDANDGLVYLMEHKTAAQIMLAYLELDDQGGTYWAVADSICRGNGWISPREHLAGITYNFLRKQFPDDRPQDDQGNYLNKDGTISKRQPAPYFVRHIVDRSPKEHASQMNRMADEVAWMNAVRSGELPVIKNTTRDCTFCPFFDMCKLHERGGDAWIEFKDARFDQRDPYERHELLRKSAS